MGNELILQDAELVIIGELDKITDSAKRKKYYRFFMSALSALPWVGGVLSYAASRNSEKEQEETNELFRWWLEKHKQKLDEFAETLNNIVLRLDQLYDNVKDKIESEAYLKIVRRAFKSWDEAETKEKRTYIQNLLVNSAATELCTYDIIRLFNSWIDIYHEVHFIVIRIILENPGISRGEIWDSFNQERPREDSAKADIFKLLIRDLSTGGVIRQARDTTDDGQFIRKRPQSRHSSSSSRTYESAFEETKPYLLTELGRQFVHYTMNEVVTRIEDRKI